MPTPVIEITGLAKHYKVPVREAGLKHVKVLYLQDSFVHDWVDKSYPVEKGH